MRDQETNIAGRVKISPRAMNLAIKNKIDISKALPTGPMGRIIERDIERLIEEKTGIMPDLSESAPVAVSGQPEAPAESPADAADAVGSADIATEDIAPVPDTRNTEEPESAQSTEIPGVSGDPKAAAARMTMTAFADASELIMFREKLITKREKLGLTDITVGGMVAYVFAKALVSRETDVRISFAAFENGAARDGLVDGSVSGLDAFSRALNARVPGFAPYAVYDLSDSEAESFTPPLENGARISLGIGKISYRAKKDGSVGAVIGLTLAHSGSDVFSAARLMEELCSEIGDFTLFLAK